MPADTDGPAALDGLGDDRDGPTDAGADAGADGPGRPRLPVAGIALAAVVLVTVGGAVVFTPTDVTKQTNPQVAVEFEYDAGENALTARHDGGSPITEENTDGFLLVVRDGARKVDRRSLDAFPYEADDTFVEGLSVAPGRAVRLLAVWDGGNPARVVLAEFEVPDGTGSGRS